MTRQVIIKPIISEKTMSNAAGGVYTFGVYLKASKDEIKKSVEDQFKVDVINVKTVILKGKKRFAGKKRIPLSKKCWKKASVMLKEGQKIDLFEVNTSEAEK